MIDPWFLRELRGLARDPDTACEGERSFRSVDTCAAEFPARTPYYYSGWERRAANEVEPRRAGVGRDPRGRPQPHRPGHRVRLLLRPRRHDGPRVRPRRGDDQLQPRDGLDRLRHLRPPVLRAAHARGRARGGRAGAPAGGDRPVRRPDPAEARLRPRAGGGAAVGDERRGDRPGRGPVPLRRLLDELGYKAPPYATASSVEEALDQRRVGRLPAAGAPLLRARRAGDGDRLLAG